ncbi:DUF3558 domain-containing protein [Actinosynnema sp. NPDC050436]|uniref:DUF3558 domain-containing protein n=1 Tax=Actinosynnema sp. NPDC050436 TaxID=3155659 RepID=UPI0033D38540
MRRSLFAVPALACVLVLGSCSGEGGTPRPDPTATTATTSSTPTSSHARPRDVTLDGRKPCDLLTPAQLTSFSIDRPGQPLDVPTLKATGCAWTVNGASNLIVPVTADGIEVWTEGNHVGKPADIDPIAGFRAVTLTTTLNPNRCDVLVDTAAGQYLAAGFSLVTDKPENFPEPCDRARRLAEAAMQNLLK